MKVLIVYESKYGNTKKVAELISEGIKSGGEHEISIENVNDIDLSKDEIYDLILIGSPNHMGGPTKTIKKFIDKLPKSPLKGKSFAVFDTYMKKDEGKAVSKMEKRINKKLPDLKKLSSGLSIKVGGMKGPIVEEDIPKCKEFGDKLIKQS
jgi:flavodoxin